MAGSPDPARPAREIAASWLRAALASVNDPTAACRLDQLAGRLMNL
jgi:hypothetical protein